MRDESLLECVQNVHVRFYNMDGNESTEKKPKCHSLPDLRSLGGLNMQHLTYVVGGGWVLQSSYPKHWFLSE